MSYIALYRKYRPAKFSEVYGQDAVVQTLRNEVRTNRISNAYLFSGPRGTGKTSIARIMARAAICLSPENGEPCGKCPGCIAKDTLDIQEIDAASNNGVDNVRDIIDTAQYKPQDGLRKVYIIDEVHMLSTGAFNALLKTLEEPPENVIFIFATTEKDKVLPTILSRCQQFQFRMLSIEQLVQAIKNVCKAEDISWKDESSLEQIAKLAKGSLRDAYSILDTLAMQNGKVPILKEIYKLFGFITEESSEMLAGKIKDGDAEGALSFIDKLESEGKTLTAVCSGLYDYYRKQLFQNSIDNSMLRNMRIIEELLEKTKHQTSKAFFEINIIKMCRPQMEKDYDSLVERIRALEKIIFDKGIEAGKKETPSIDIKDLTVIKYMRDKKKYIVTLKDQKGESIWNLENQPPNPWMKSPQFVSGAENQR